MATGDKYGRRENLCYLQFYILGILNHINLSIIYIINYIYIIYKVINLVRSKSIYWTILLVKLNKVFISKIHKFFHLYIDNYNNKEIMTLDNPSEPVAEK